MGESFWQNYSLVTHIRFELQPIILFSPVANFGDQSLGRKKMDRKSGLLSNIDFLFNQPTIETYCNNAGNIVCQYVLSKYYKN